jgi:RHS repeat-associated protein
MRRAPRRVTSIPVLLVAGLATVTSCSTTTRDTHSKLVAAQHVTFHHGGFGAGPALFTGGDGTLLEERRYEAFGSSIDSILPSEGHHVAVAPDHAARDLNSLNRRTEAATGWSDHGARWMIPESSRWLTPDPPVEGPSGEFMSAPWALHPYQYVEQNPIRYWDPDGREPRGLEHLSREELLSRIANGQTKLRILETFDGTHYRGFKEQIMSHIADLSSHEVGLDLVRALAAAPHNIVVLPGPRRSEAHAKCSDEGRLRSDGSRNTGTHAYIDFEYRLQDTDLVVNDMDRDPTAHPAWLNFGHEGIHALRATLGLGAYNWDASSFLFTNLEEELAIGLTFGTGVPTVDGFVFVPTENMLRQERGLPLRRGSEGKDRRFESNGVRGARH